MTTRRQFLFGSVSAMLVPWSITACSGRPSTGGVTDVATPPMSGGGTRSVPVDTVRPRPTEPVDTTSTTSVVETVPPTAPWDDADFSDLDAFLASTGGEAFAIVENGVTIHEWYRTDATYARDIASAQKSVLSLAVGRAIGDGLLAMDTGIDEVLGPTWTADGGAPGVDVEQLLAMTSGLDDRLRAVAEPGTEWHYSGAFAALFDVLETVTGRPIAEIGDDWVFGPAGATDASFYERRSSRFAPIGLFATVPDLIAIGQATLDTTLPGIADSWYPESWSPSQPFNRSYGRLWWLNGQDSFLLPGSPITRPGPIVPAAPPSMVGAWGKDDQKLYVVPGQRLLVARLGGRAVPTSQAAWSPFDQQLWERLAVLRG